MSVIVFVRRRARAGQAAALAGAMIAPLHASPAIEPRSRFARVCRGRDDPNVILYLGEWQSREHYVARCRADQMDARCAPFVAAPAERRYLRPLSRYERVDLRAALVSCMIVRCEPEAATGVRDFILGASGQRVRDLPDLVERVVSCDEDSPDCLIIHHAWRTASIWETHMLRTRGQLDQRLVALGATVEHFVALTVEEVDRMGAAPAPSLAGLRPPNAPGALD